MPRAHVRTLLGQTQANGDGCVRYIDYPVDTASIDDSAGRTRGVTVVSSVGVQMIHGLIVAGGDARSVCFFDNCSLFQAFQLSPERGVGERRGGLRERVILALRRGLGRGGFWRR